MRASLFKSLLDELPRLNPGQLSDLRAAIDALNQRVNTMAAFDVALEGSGCPHCNSFKFCKNGFSRGLQRYRCGACLKTFNAATNTPLSRLRSKDKFFQHGECLMNGLTIRSAAKEMGVAVSTAFRRRHRFLEAVVDHQPKGVTGIFEADETYFREAQKGKRNLARNARKRGGKEIKKKSSKRDLVPVLIGRLRGQPHVADHALSVMSITETTDALRGVVGPETLMCIDGSAALRGAAKSLGAAFHSVPVSYGPRVVEGVYHVQSVNSYHQRLKTWVNRDLRGVSTKYMPNYLAWMRLKEWYKNDLKPEHFVISGLGRQIINT